MRPSNALSGGGGEGVCLLSEGLDLLDLLGQELGEALFQGLAMR